MQENTGKFKGTGLWKFPTGVVEEVILRAFIELLLHFHQGCPVLVIFSLLRTMSQGEDICDAARREVKEETGVSH